MLARRSIVFLCCLSAAASASAASVYSVTPLGILPGGISSSATSLDISGEVAGYTTFADNSTRAFYWTPGGGMIGLGTVNSKALGVNSGNVVGYEAPSEDSEVHHAFRWTSGAGTVLLDPSNQGQANGVNSSGEAIGTRYNVVSSALVWHALTWDSSNSPTPFPTLHLTGTALNNLGQFVGLAGVGGSNGYYSDGLGSFVSLASSLLPTSLSDTQFAAGTLNGVAVFENLHDQSITTIGTLADDPTANALGINPLGTQVVGVSAGHGGFLYDINTRDMESLTYLLDPAFNGWNILSASAVNDNGQIVGMGEFNGVQEAVLLTPVPEPASWVLLTVGAVGLFAWAARRQTGKAPLRGSVAV